MARTAGQIRGRGAGRWLVTVYKGAAGGKREYVSHTVKGSRKKAETKLRAMLGEKDEGRLTRSDHRPVGEYLDWWIANVVKPRVRLSTFESYKLVVETYLKPELGAVRLDKLTTLQVQALVRTLSDRGLKARTVRYAFSVLNGALRKAVKLRLLSRNPFEEVELPRQTRRELQVPGEAARARLLAELQADTLWPLWCVMVTAGLRPGEALGLKWGDLTDGVLTVQRALSRTKGAWELGEPKTAQGRRVVHVPAEAVAVLAEHEERQRKEREAFEKDHPGVAEDLGLVFADALGRPLSWTNVRHRHFAPALSRAILTCHTCGVRLRKAKDRKLVHAGPIRLGTKAKADHKPEPFAELEGLRPYDLRHLHASLLLAGGVSLRTASERLGHADPGFTLKVYTHLVPGGQEAAAVAIGAAVFGKPKATNGAGR